MTLTRHIADFVQQKLTPTQFGRLREMYVSVLHTGDPLKVFFLRKAHRGRRTYIDPTAHFLGWKHIRLGDDCVIAEHCWFNVNGRVGDRVTLEIEHHSYIGRRNFFSTGRYIKVGAYALTGVDCKFMGSDHVFSDPMKPYIATGTTSDNVIDIGANCWLGAGVSVIGNVSIGHGTIVGAGALVLKDIPPFSLVIGSPARVIKRFNVELGEWIDVGEFTAEMEALLPSPDQYLGRLMAAQQFIMMPKAAAGRAWGDLP